MKIIICDDEKIFSTRIKDLVMSEFEDLGQACEVKVINDSRIFMEEYLNKNVDLIILDIEMPYFSGIDVVSGLSKKSLNNSVIFVTNHNELVFETLRYHPFQFVRKQYLEVELKVALEDYLKIYKRPKSLIKISDNQGHHIVYIEEIMYIETVKNKIEFVCITGTRYGTRMALSEVEKNYKSDHLCRIHSGIIINLNYLLSIEKDFVILENEIKLPLSRRRRCDVKKSFMQYLHTTKQ